MYSTSFDVNLVRVNRALVGDANSCAPPRQL
jgi:hypothetical protein